ncbi:amino acid ABC transporter permease [Bifidobacterium callitrichos]|uniref:Amino acid ABC transporter permease n=2 Tax=Bifidobacterium callitrichos TaxID=762209 RepID=A0A5M9ZE45_9BIFI|nr:amino acid ABC transporter permease [Bifidobacterium callitrichos]KAA8817233.1 amino acid ABC transporter permease [Bifidobacterium callitrichos]KFI50817.1 polar amino acid ABC transporter permease [Bifidobacterium callitrichos DSM 23973]
MSWAAILSALPIFEKAFVVTLRLSAISVTLAAVLGLVLALVREYRVPVLAQASSVFEELFRNTPLLIQLFFLYYGLPSVGVRWSAEACAVIGMSVFGSAYMSGAFTGGFSGIPRVQKESARALGLSPLQMIRHVTLPQGLTRSVPAVAANVIFMVKETSVFTVIAVPELTNTARDLIGMYYRSDEYLLMLVVAYAIILIPLSVLLTLLERRVRRGTFGDD